MKTVLLMTADDMQAGRGELLGLAVSRGWAFAGLSKTGRKGGSRRRGGYEQVFETEAVAVPEGWPSSVKPVGESGRAVRWETYRSAADIAGLLSESKGSGKWLAVRSGRYAVAIEGAVLQRASRACGTAKTDVIAVSVREDRQGYAEELRTSKDGKVLGFRRTYNHRVGDSAIPAEWPAVVLVRRTAAARLRDALMEARSAPRAGSSSDVGMSSKGSFADFMSGCEGAGLRVKALALGGRQRDLSEAGGLLEQYALYAEARSSRTEGNGRVKGCVAPGARLVGRVTVEEGACVEEGAIVIGPAFVGSGARVERGAIVRGGIIAPGTVVTSATGADSPSEGTGGGIVRNAVVTKDGRMLSAKPRGAGDADAGAEGPFREWPVFSHARLGKRVIDIVGSVLALSALALVFPLIAIAIKVSSKGPVFYRHRRQGRRGKVFKCIKFRTMMTGADALQEELTAVNEVDGPQFKIDEDPRITLVGDFLRATNLDEVPQFWNVLKGQMSIVGPRPSPDEENQFCPSWRAARLSVRPGITGLWQVSRLRGQGSDFQEWIYYDTKYVRELSLWLDLGIMARTAWVLTRGFAALFAGKAIDEESD